MPLSEAMECAMHNEAVATTVRPEFQRLNQEWFFLVEGGRARVLREQHDEQLDRDYYEAFPLADFAALYGNQYITVPGSKPGETKQIPLGRAWLTAEARRTYNRAVFDPGATDLPPTTFNFWTGLMDARPGNWQRFNDHLFDVICGGDDEVYRWVRKWIARGFQFPGKWAETALVLLGVEGLGKGIFAHACRRPFRQHGLHVSQSSHLTGHFNHHLRDACFLFADEAVFSGDRAAHSALKSIITEPVLTIEQKYHDPITVPNRLKIIMASNDDHVVRASREARRFCVLRVADTYRGNRSYFHDLNRELYEEGGLEAFVFEMLREDLAGFDHRTPPETAALTEQITRTFSAIEKWWFERLIEERPVSMATSPEPGLWRFWDTSEIEVRKRDLHADYLRFLEVHREPVKAARATSTELGMFLKRNLPDVWPKVRQDNGPGGDLYLLPNLPTCRDGFAGKRGALFTGRVPMGP